jgi:putative hemolysin
VELVVGLVLIAGSGFFSGSETSVYRAHWVRLRTWSGRRRPGSSLALRLLNWRGSTVVAILVGNSLCNVFASMLFSEFFASTLGPAYAGLAVVLVVSLTLVFGEFLPKAMAQSSPNRWLSNASAPLTGFLVLFAPVVLVLNGIARIFATPFTRPRAKMPLTRQDFLSAMKQREQGNGDGKPAQERSGPPISAMVARLFRFSGLKLEEAAIPLEQVESVPEHVTREQVQAVIDEHGFSRIPVYRDTKDNITGVILAKDLLTEPGVRVRSIKSVPEDSRLMEVLERMRHAGTHMAVVEDKGEVTGIVTLEDILEELVGEIRSED